MLLFKHMTHKILKALEVIFTEIFNCTQHVTNVAKSMDSIFVKRPIYTQPTKIRGFHFSKYRQLCPTARKPDMPQRHAVSPIYKMLHFDKATSALNTHLAVTRALSCEDLVFFRITC